MMMIEGGVTCIGSKFGHHVALLAFVANLASRYQMALLAYSDLSQIGSKFGHHVTSLALLG